MQEGVEVLQRAATAEQAAAFERQRVAAIVRLLRGAHGGTVDGLRLAMAALQDNAALRQEVATLQQRTAAAEVKSPERFTDGACLGVQRLLQ